MTKTEDFIRKARLKLSSTKFRFFGLCLYPIRTVITEEDKDLEGYVRYDTSGDKYENHIYINSKIVDEEPSYKTINMIDIMLHEFNHIIRRHDIRRGSRNFEAWNVACDHVIDKSLKRLGLSKPIRKWNIIYEIEYDDNLQSEEEVYKWIMKNSNHVQVSANSDGSISFNSPNQNIRFHPDLVKDIKPEEKQVVEDYVSQIRAVYNIEKEKGSLPNNVKELFDDLLKVNIPWEILLEKAIKSKATEKANRRSWRRLNKFYVNLNINLPGFIPRRDKDSVSVLIVHIDSSGSMSNKDLQKAGYIIYKSAQYFDKIKLIVADVRIHQEVEFGNRDYNNIINYFKTSGISGRGGTSHKEVFEYFDKYYEEHGDDLSLCISITDLCSDIKEVIKSCKFIKAVPLILINTSDRTSLNFDNLITINVLD